MDGENRRGVCVGRSGPGGGGGGGGRLTIFAIAAAIMLLRVYNNIVSRRR